MIEVTLSGWEILHAANAGVMRQVDAIKKGQKDKPGVDKYRHWQFNCEACLSEYAFAKHFKLYWPGKGNIGDVDVGHNFEIRNTPYPDGELRVEPTDDPGRQVWLVTGIYGRYFIPGWIRAGDAQREENWSDKMVRGRFAYWIPQQDLIKTEDLERGDQ